MTNSHPSRPVIGIFWMAFTGLCFVAVTAIVKHVGDGVPAAQAAFLRYVLGLVFLVPMIKPILAARLTSRQLRLFGVRGVVHTVAVILWFFAMARIPIAEVTAMNYLSPVYVSIGAALFLGERLPPRRLAAVIMALIGALIILRPGVKAVEIGHIAMLATAICFAVGYLVAKQLSGEVSAAVVVGMLSMTVTIGLAPFAWAVWVTPTLQQLGFDSDAAGHLLAVGLGCDFGCCGLCRGRRWLGRVRRCGDYGIGQLYHLARGCRATCGDASCARNKGLAGFLSQPREQ